jgi:hypothetical protein
MKALDATKTRKTLKIKAFKLKIACSILLSFIYLLRSRKDSGCGYAALMDNASR